MSWTGTEYERREQGTCKPPSTPRVRTARYTIPAGTQVKVRLVEWANWKPYRTKAPVQFSRFERQFQGVVVARHGAYQIMVGEHLLRHHQPEIPP